MKFLIACDKFKGSLSAIEVCKAIAAGIQQRDEKADIKIQPLADGGDGTMILLRDLLGLETIEMETLDPLGRSITAKYYTDEQRAYVELAEASGIARLKPTELNPMQTHTLGTGTLIADAIQRGYSEIIFGLGGSCTNDAGLGICYGLGYRFMDKDQSELVPCGGNLSQIQEIIPPVVIQKIQFKLLCDVKNPLYGPTGAAYTYAAQKGANLAQIVELDRGLRRVSQLIENLNGSDISSTEGGGAAGGIAGGLIGLLGATSQSGFEYIKEVTALEEKIKAADIIITGEGKLDQQSLQGKVVGHMAHLCQLYHKPLIVIAGASDLDPYDARQKGIDQVFTILSRAKGIEDAMDNPRHYLIEIGKEINTQFFS